MLRKVIIQKGDWIKMFPMLVFTYNSTRNKTLGYSPFEVVFGRNLPFGSFYGLDFSERWKAFRKSVLPVVKSNQAIAQKRMTDSYNKYHNTKDVHLQVGSLVFYLNMNKRNKYDSPYLGPYLVTKLDKKTNRAYLKSALTEQPLKNPVSIELLKIEQCDLEDLIPLELEKELDWEVLSLLDVRITEKGKEYLVLWKNWPEPTWAAEYKLDNCKH